MTKKQLNNNIWQKKALEEIIGIFDQSNKIKSIILVGSMADESTDIDYWSDIDLKVILDDDALDSYYLNSEWVKPLGDIFSIENHKDNFFQTSRICLRNFYRFDITFITLSSLDQIKSWQSNPFQGKYQIIKDELSSLQELIATIPVAKYEKRDKSFFLEFENQFWHKVHISIVKLMRNDLLISTHLTLDLVKDCLVLKMILRDELYKSNIHRTGEWGNEYINKLPLHELDSKDSILRMIGSSCVKFDQLMIELNSDYIKKSDVVSEWINKAKSEIS